MGIADGQEYAYSNLNKKYSYFKNQILLNLGNAGDNENAVNSVLTNFNFVQELLMRSNVQWEDLELKTTPSLVVNKADYLATDLNFDTQFHKIYSIKLFADGRWYPPMAYLTPKAWDEKVASLTNISVGKPYVYTKWGKVITFYQTPDAAYPLEIRATVYPKTILNDEDDVTFFSVDALLINLTTAYTWLSMGERDLATSFFNAAIKLMSAYDKDLISMLNFKSASNIPTSLVNNYWIDPFQRRMP